MELRPLGRTGVQVSPLCLGAMMFGAWGNPDHDESIRIIHRALDAGINFIDTADVYSQRRVGGDRRQGAGRRPARRRRARDEVPRPDGRRRRTSAATRGAGSCRRSRASLRRLGTDWIDLYQVHRYDTGTDIEETLGALDRPRPPGQGPLRRLLDVPGVARSSRRSGCARAARPAALRRASSRRTRCSCAGSRPTCCRPAQRYGMGVIPWSPLSGGWLSGRYRKGADIAEPTSAARRRLPDRYDLSLPGEPGQARGRRRSSRSSPTRRASRSIQLAHRVGHPPSGGDGGDHRPAHDGAARVPAGRGRRRLDDALLDRIDEIVPPGVEHQPRRRRVAEPGAGGLRAAAVAASVTVGHAREVADEDHHERPVAHPQRRLERLGCRDVNPDDRAVGRRRHPMAEPDGTDAPVP